MKPFFTHKIYILLFLSSILLHNCQQAPNKQNIIINPSETTVINSQDLFTTAKIIPLETTDFSLIARIDKIILHEARIYILDTRQNIVFIFNNNGHFLFKIDQSGRGPQEYNILYDININPYNQQIELLDAMGYLLTFDLNGKFVSKQTLPKEIPAYHQFQRIDQDRIVLCCTSSEKMLYVYSMAQKKISGMYIENESRYSIGQPSIYTWHDTIYFSRPLFDQIYYVNKEGPHLAFEWFISGYDYDPIKAIPEYDRNNFQEFKKITDNLPYVYWKNYQNKDYLYSSIQLDGKAECINVFHNKTTKNNIIFKELNGNLPFTVDYMDDDLILNIIPATNITNYPKLLILDPASKEMLKKNTDMNNPYLIEYKFK